MARDIIHDAVRNALVKDGWTITDDPLTLSYEDLYAFVDLGAERVLAAKRGEEKIAVEIKSFRSRSAVADFERALGQYILYERLLRKLEPDRVIFLAISEPTYFAVFEREAFRYLAESTGMQVIVVDIEAEEIEKWVTFN